MKCECGAIVSTVDSEGGVEKYECVDCGRTGTFDLNTRTMTGCLKSDF
jgi:hypothetical protein